MFVTHSSGQNVTVHYCFLFHISLANLPGCLTVPVGLYNVIIIDKTEGKNSEIKKTDIIQVLKM